eukprot:Ihof_evm16s30 gene=Ihof_evmTU16s30
MDWSSLLALVHKHTQSAIVVPALQVLAHLFLMDGQSTVMMTRQLQCTLHTHLLSHDPDIQVAADACTISIFGGDTKSCSPSALSPASSAILKIAVNSQWAYRLSMLALKSEAPEVLARSGIQRYTQQSIHVPSIEPLPQHLSLKNRSDKVTITTAGSAELNTKRFQLGIPKSVGFIMYYDDGGMEDCYSPNEQGEYTGYGTLDNQDLEHGAETFEEGLSWELVQLQQSLAAEGVTDELEIAAKLGMYLLETKATLEKEVEQLCTAEHNRLEEIAHLQETVSSYKLQLARSAEQHEVASQHIEGLQSDLASLRANRDYDMSECRDLRAENHRLARNAERLNEYIMELEEGNNNKKNTIRLIEAELARLQEDMGDRRDIPDGFEDDLSNMGTAMRGKNAQDDEDKRIKDQLKSLLDEVVTLHDELDKVNLLNDTLMTQVVEMEAQCGDKDGEITRLQQTLQQQLEQMNYVQQLPMQISSSSLANELSKQPCEFTGSPSSQSQPIPIPLRSKESSMESSSMDSLHPVRPRLRTGRLLKTAVERGSYHAELDTLAKGLYRLMEQNRRFSVPMPIVGAKEKLLEPDVVGDHSSLRPDKMIFNRATSPLAESKMRRPDVQQGVAKTSEKETKLVEKPPTHEPTIGHSKEPGMKQIEEQLEAGVQSDGHASSVDPSELKTLTARLDASEKLRADIRQDSIQHRNTLAKLQCRLAQTTNMLAESRESANPSLVHVSTPKSVAQSNEQQNIQAGQTETTPQQPTGSTDNEPITSEQDDESLSIPINALSTQVEQIETEVATARAKLLAASTALAAREEIDQRVQLENSRRMALAKQTMVEAVTKAVTTLRLAGAKQQLGLQRLGVQVDKPEGLGETSHLAGLVLDLSNEAAELTDRLKVAVNVMQSAQPNSQEQQDSYHVLKSTVDLYALVHSHALLVALSFNVAVAGPDAPRSKPASQLALAALQMLTTIQESWICVEEAEHTDIASQLQMPATDVTSAIQMLQASTAEHLNEQQKQQQQLKMVAKEMTSTTTIVSNASKRIEQLLQESKTVHTGVHLDMDASILEGCGQLMVRVHSLMEAAVAVQDRAGRLVESNAPAGPKAFYKKDHSWGEGLVGAAKTVGWGATVLVDCVEEVINAMHNPATMRDGSFERLVVASREVAASVVQLVTASWVKDVREEGKADKSVLEKASKEVSTSAKALVRAVQNTHELIITEQQAASQDQKPHLPSTDQFEISALQSKRLEMEIQ